MRRVGLALVALLVTAPARAADSMTVDLARAVTLVTTGAADLEAADLDVASAQNTAEVRSHAWRPDLSARAEMSGSLGRTFSSQVGTNVTEPLASASVGLSSSVILYSGGQLRAQLDAAEAGVASAQMTLASTRQQLVWQVTDLLLALGEAEAQVHVREATLSTAEALQARLSAQVELGVGTPGDLALQRAEVASARAGVVNAERGRREAVFALERLLRLDPTLPWVFLPPEQAPAVPPEDLATLHRRALGARLDVAAAQADVAAAEAQVRAASGGRLPRVSLGASTGTAWLSTTDEALAAQLTDRGSLSTSLSVSMPLLDRTVTRGSVYEAELNLERRRLAVVRLSESIALDIEALRVAHDSSAEALLAARTQREAAELALREVEARFELGSLALPDVAAARASLSSAQSQEVTAAFSLRRQAWALQWVLGALG